MPRYEGHVPFVSKTMTKILRHHGSHREDDGAIVWKNCCSCCVATTNMKTTGNGRIRNGLIFFIPEVIRKDFNCLNSGGVILVMRAIQSHFGGSKVDLLLLENGLNSVRME